eukprot:TRINITY_DN1019_c2_g1_i1.p1 TRINITY_DN1019_c2_g1~~TRINITY_DN1019_c2_g1_i1.p1  ORF type:complete len:244 (+),score=70.77 TRINITY_DN1019_c2_g1_i1:86-733(+)
MGYDEGVGHASVPGEQQPVNGVVVQTYDVVAPQPPQVIYVDEQKEDYFPACLGTALFGCFGIAGMFVCCPSNYGKLGASSGFAWFNLWRALVIFVILMLVVAGSIDCSKDIYPDEISQHKCADINGTWNSTQGACFGACPDGYDLTYATDNSSAMLKDENGQWPQWCHESDPTCTGLSRGQLIANLVISFILFGIAAYFVARYTKRIKNTTYEPV